MTIVSILCKSVLFLPLVLLPSHRPVLQRFLYQPITLLKPFQCHLSNISNNIHAIDHLLLMQLPQHLLLLETGKVGEVHRRGEGFFGQRGAGSKGGEVGC